MKQKNIQTMQELFQSYGPMVYRRCFAIVKEEEVAKDLMQDVFVRVIEKNGLPLENPSSFLYTIATNLSLNFVRDHKKMLESDDVLLSIAAADDIAGQSARKQLLGRLFAGQKRDTRVMAYMHWVDGYTLKEISEELQYSVSGVRKRLREFKEQVSGLRERELVEG